MNTIKLELSEHQAWVLTEILSQYVDELGTDDDLVNSGLKIYQKLIDVRSNKGE